MAMDLFKLRGTIEVDNSGAKKALKETTDSAKETGNAITGASDSGDSASGKWAGAFQKIGSGALAVGKTVVKGTAVAAAGVSALATAAINSYADYEQLVGGVDTLFKDASAKVQEYAKNAYQTAGMSANEYMETVTSFSASLLQSLDGDTTAAAEKANMAITDMSDNANKMGTDMEAIQNAYNGFAKANYTMLDNLKLGYGGTKEEMQRLLADAEAISGIEYDISSYADVVDAIHVIQTEMGITGTTAKEASSTISGSISSMKSSWQNLLTAISADDLPFDDYVDSFVNSVSTVAENLLPRIEIALNGVVSLVEKLAPVLIAKVPELVSSLLPSIVTAATGLIQSIVQAFPELINVFVTDILPLLITSLGTIAAEILVALPAIVTSLFDSIWGLIKQGAGNLPLDSLQPLFDDLSALFTNVSEAVKPLLDAFGEYVTSGQLVEDATNLIRAAAETLATAYENVKSFVVAVVDGFKDAVTWGKEHETAVQMIAIAIGTLTTAIIAYNAAQAIKAAGGIAEIAQLGVMAVQLGALTVAQAAHTAAVTVATAATTAFGAVMSFITSPITLVVAAIGALIAIGVLLYKNWDEVTAACKTAWEAVKNAISTAVEAVKNAVSTAFEAVKNAVSNALNTVKTTASNVWNSIKTTVSNVVNGIKTTVSNVWNGIKSTTSSVFNGIKSTAATVWNGIKTAITTPIEKARDTIKGIIDKISGFFSGAKLEFPNIKLPHFSIKPSGWKISDLLEGSIPKLSIDWYAKAMRNPMVMTSPTVFGYDAASGKLMGGGESGSEVVSGTGTLMNMIQSAVASQNEAVVYYMQKIIEVLAAYFPQLLEAFDMDIVLDDGTLVGKIAPAMNIELGKISTKKDRGR